MGNNNETSGYKILSRYVGDSWARVICENVKTKSRGRLVIPYKTTDKIERFYEIIGDKKIADILIENFGGYRLFARRYRSKLYEKAINSLKSTGFNDTQIAGIIRADIELLGYQHKRNKKNDNQLDLDI
ncbi:hypothetical protein [Francisella philomiragia]|uniref:hypothetical protein n=1 Tax=Francisella philomiragia TaxID=28110 RepID=UPI001C9D7852|nr:hypothetical protein [Francisella philomiragia]MBY7733473.1 hypothetical protein [Francisella philomiragia]